jgi:hypothetical protein
MFKNKDQNDLSNEKLTGGSGYKGALQISYKEIAEVLGEMKEYDEEWQGYLWNGLYFNIYPANYDNIWSLDQLRRNRQWNVGGQQNVVYPLIAFMVGHIDKYILIDDIIRKLYENP